MIRIFAKTNDKTLNLVDAKKTIFLSPEASAELDRLKEKFELS